MSKSKYPDPKDFISNPGSPIHDLYSAKVDKDGTVILTKVGEENTDEKIQAAAASTDIATILAYYNQTGDESVLNRYIPHYGDFANIPKSLAEFLQLRIDSENFFNALPVNVKEKFDNDSNKFFAQAGEESWYKKLQSVVDPNGDSEVTSVEPES